jgi:hypothetical protein
MTLASGAGTLRHIGWPSRQSNATHWNVSWRVVLFNFDGHPPPDDLDMTFRPHPMGPAERARDSISELLCDVDWSDPSRGFFYEDGYVMWFRIEPHGIVDRIDVEILGEGNPVPVLSHICLVNGWLVYDTNTRVFLDPDESRARGWEDSQRVLKD